MVQKYLVLDLFAKRNKDAQNSDWLPRDHALQNICLFLYRQTDRQTRLSARRNDWFIIFKKPLFTLSELLQPLPRQRY